MASNVVDWPCATERVDGETPSVKSPAGALGFTTSVTTSESLGELLASAAVIVSGYVPGVVPAAVVTVSVVDPDPLVKPAGENVPVAPEGRPVTE